MLAWSRIRFSFAATLLVLFTPLLGASQAARFPAEQPVSLAGRVAMLEGRLYKMEKRLAAVEQGRITPRADGSFHFEGNGARVVVSPDGAVTTVRLPDPTPGAPPAAHRKPDCDPPYTVDRRGIRTIKAECLEVAECDPPYSVDADGIRRPKPGCP
jgi:hypothetical protein